MPGSLSFGRSDRHARLAQGWRKLSMLLQLTLLSIRSRPLGLWQLAAEWLGAKIWGEESCWHRPLALGEAVSARVLRCSFLGCGRLRRLASRTNEMHRTQDSYESVSCNCRAECSLEASACAWGVGDLEGRSAAAASMSPEILVLAKF